MNHLGYALGVATNGLLVATITWILAFVTVPKTDPGNWGFAILAAIITAFVVASIITAPLASLTVSLLMKPMNLTSVYWWGILAGLIQTVLFIGMFMQTRDTVSLTIPGMVATMLTVAFMVNTIVLVVVCLFHH